MKQGGAIVEGQGYNSHLTEYILQLLHLLKENGMEIDQVLSGNWPTEQLSPEDIKKFQEVYGILKFMDEIPGGFLIYYADGDKQVIYANKGVLRIFKCETMKEFRDLTGNSFTGMVDPEDLEDVEKSIETQISGKEYDLDYVEYRIRCKDGTVRWVEDYGHFIRGGAIGDVFYVFLGESTEKRSQQQMEQKRELAEALEKARLAVKAKNTFLSHISHDMRTPLNAIFGFTTLAKTGLQERDLASVGEYLDQIETAGHQLLDMISKVLYVSELRSAGGPAEVECDLCKTVQDTYDFLLPQAQEKSILFTLDCSDVKHSGIYADEEKLRQLVMSLANNAMTYTKPGGKVSITLTEKEELPDSYAVYCLVVEDNGIGIGKEFVDNMFEPFSREKNSTLSGVHGIGLGLTIVKSIVDIMHGSIDVKSSVNEGSTFTVDLVFRYQPLPDHAEGDPHSPSLRILLVEDNEINREIETELLERIGFIIDPAENGKEALEKVERSAPGDYDLIIMDLQMPVMNGWQAAAAIRSLPDPTLSHIPIIALSANILISDRRKALESGIEYYLSKPLDFNALLETIEKIRKRDN